MYAENIVFQLTPAGIHRRKKVKRAIQIFKSHFISGLCTVDPKFPLNLWDKLTPQEVLTLNILRASSIKPRISSYAQVHGAFNYNRTPLPPPQAPKSLLTSVQNHQFWAPHALHDLYIGSAMKYYCCHRIWIPSTNSSRICETVKW